MYAICNILIYIKHDLHCILDFKKKVHVVIFTVKINLLNQNILSGLYRVEYFDSIRRHIIEI